MELRHLRYFLAVAEELHFARAAERLHIDQSPLSRAVKELEEELGARLFVRTTRSSQLTLAGRFFLEHVPRVFASIEQARDSVRSAATGFHGQLRIALSDGITPSRLPCSPAACRSPCSGPRSGHCSHIGVAQASRPSFTTWIASRSPRGWMACLRITPSCRERCPSWGRRCRAILARPANAVLAVSGHGRNGDRLGASDGHQVGLAG